MKGARVAHGAEVMKKACGIAALCGGLLALAAIPRPFEPVLGCVRRDAWAHSPGLFWTMQVGDLLILLAYLWIPVEALDLRARLRLTIGLAFVGVAAFVLLCGAGHGLDALTAWYPIYWLSAEVRVVTAAVSLTVAGAVRWYFKPRILELAAAAADRDRAVSEAKAVAESLRVANDELTRLREAAEQRGDVAEREREAASERAGELSAALQEKQELLEALELQRLVVQQLGTTIIPVRRRPTVLVVPIQGTLDSRRMQDLQESVAARVETERAATVIVDLTGVSAVDTAVAHCLLQTGDILSYMGCRCVITGMRSAVATSVVDLGVSMPQLTFFGELADGLAHAEKQVKR